jgi:hypothetical protein
MDKTLSDFLSSLRLSLEAIGLIYADIGIYAISGRSLQVELPVWNQFMIILLLAAFLFFGGSSLFHFFIYAINKISPFVTRLVDAWRASKEKPEV